MENASNTEEHLTLTQRVLNELAERGPGAEVMVRELAIKLGEYEPPDPETGEPSKGDCHPVRQVLNRLSRASFADTLGMGPIERAGKFGPMTIYKVLPTVHHYVAQRDDLQNV